VCVLSLLVDDYSVVLISRFINVAIPPQLIVRSLLFTRHLRKAYIFVFKFHIFTSPQKKVDTNQFFNSLKTLCNGLNYLNTSILKMLSISGSCIFVFLFLFLQTLVLLVCLRMFC
jgi:hypothetical protein